MNISLNDPLYDTRQLLDIFLHAGSSPGIAIRLPDVIDINTNLRIGSEQPWKDSSAMYFRTDHKGVYIIDSSSPEGYSRIGKISNNVQESVSLQGVHWFICDSSLDAGWLNHRFLEKYLRFDSLEFAYTLYGEFFTLNGNNSGHDWSGILLKPWSAIDLNDSAYLVSPASELHPFLLKTCSSEKLMPLGNLYVFKGLATKTRIPVFYNDQRIGSAEGFRLVSSGGLLSFRFTLYEYNNDLIPANLWWKNHLVINHVSATAAACRGCFITRFDVDIPPAVMLKPS